MAIKVLPEERVQLLKKLIRDEGIHLLYWDLESSPNVGYFWSSGEQYVSYKQIRQGEETKIITIQYMWEGDNKPKYLVWNKLPAEDGLGVVFDDSSMIEEFITNVLRLHNPDNVIVIGQNHKAFDHKLLNERAKVLRLTPPIQSMVKIDTYRSSKQSFKTASHSLDARSKQYNLGGKEHTDLSTWTDILECKAEPEDILIPYGLKDVTDLRTIFWNDLPYYETLPAPLEKLLIQAKAKCKICEARKERKYDLEECRVSGKRGYMCLNCGNKFTLDR